MFGTSRFIANRQKKLKTLICTANNYNLFFTGKADFVERVRKSAERDGVRTTAREWK